MKITNMNKFGIISITVFIVSMSLTYLLPAESQLQTTATSKVYEYCNIVDLQDINYIDGRQISYDVSCEITRIIIHNYQDISDTDKSTIDTRLETKGYTEKEEINSDTGEVIISK